MVLQKHLDSMEKDVDSKPVIKKQNDKCYWVTNLHGILLIKHFGKEKIFYSYFTFLLCSHGATLPHPHPLSIWVRAF